MKLTHTMYLAWLLLISLDSGCATSPAVHDGAPAAPLTQLTIDIEYVDADNAPVPAAYQPANVVLAFPHIPGQIFGSPSGPPVLITPVSVDSPAVLPLRRVANALSDQLETLRPVPVTRGLTITPADTRLTRIGTFPHDAKTLDSIRGGESS